MPAFAALMASAMAMRSRTASLMKKNIDLHLLVCLDALLTERSVTRAAARLEMSQPGMSNALARLRMLIGDPLLVRSGNEFRPTERALGLAAKVRSGLTALDEIFADEGPLEPQSAEGTITVAGADSVGVMLMPLLADAVARHAPKVRIHVRLPDPEKLREWLAEGECDIAIGHFPDVAEDMRSTNLFDQTLSCLSGPKHALPPSGMDLDHYLASSHAFFGSPFSPISTMEATIDRTLERMGKSRRRAVQISSVLLIPYVIAGSPHLASLPTWLASHYAHFLPLAVHPLPFEVPQIGCRMVWHERTHRVGLHRWTRGLLRTLAQELADSDGAVGVASSMSGITFADGLI
ncbi:putative transcriptional regulator [Burkholderiales bacterium 8X]|nr:putative transcriptional regulator [Burkholderiales bacterium 8X]